LRTKNKEDVGSSIKTYLKANTLFFGKLGLIAVFASVSGSVDCSNYPKGICSTTYNCTKTAAPENKMKKVSQLYGSPCETLSSLHVLTSKAMFGLFYIVIFLNKNKTMATTEGHVENFLGLLHSRSYDALFAEFTAAKAGKTKSLQIFLFTFIMQ
jgi:hypothetical protein